MNNARVVEEVSELPKSLKITCLSLTIIHTMFLFTCSYELKNELPADLFQSLKKS